MKTGGRRSGFTYRRAWARAEELALEVDRLAVEEPRHDRQRLLGSTELLARRRPVEPRRNLVHGLARPDEIRFTDALPKTRSGKIMRRLLREIATSGTVAGDVTTLEDFSVLEKLRAEEE